MGSAIESSPPPPDVTPEARRSVLVPLDPEGRAGAVAERLREAIFLGVVLDGDSLPSEADLSAELAVSNKTLREALVVLRQEGLIETRRGRSGGSFVHSRTKTSRKIVRQRLAELSVSELRDLSDEHRAVAGMCAYLAAQRADSDQLERLALHASRLEGQATDLCRARADSQFHIEVALASQSERLTRAEVRLQSDSRDLLWLSEPGIDFDGTCEVHQAIRGALAAQDPIRARDLSEQHVADTYRHLLDLRLRLRRS